MELVRALSNHATRNKLTRLSACQKRLLQGARYDARPTSRPPARAGDMARAVVTVLAKSGDSMKVSEVQQAVEGLLQRQVNRGSLKACLSEGARATTPKFQRTERGYYRLANPSRPLAAGSTPTFVSWNLSQE